MRIIKTELHESLIFHYMLLTRQLTKLSDCFHHIIRLDFRVSGYEKEELFFGYKVYAQSELADAICQIKKICQALEISYTATEKIGDERDKEKEAEFAKRYPNEPWV